MYRRILASLDDSPFAEGVLLRAQVLAKSERVEVILPGVSAGPVAGISPQEYLIAKKYIEAVSAKSETAGARVSCLIHEGPVVEKILASEEDMRMGLITMSTHGWSNIQHLIVGSVADHVKEG